MRCVVGVLSFGHHQVLEHFLDHGGDVCRVVLWFVDAPDTENLYRGGYLEKVNAQAERG